MEVLRCDPPRARQEGPDGFVGLDEIARRADVVSFHTPLIREGADRTFHLADEAFFRSLERQPVLLNTSRGEVVNLIIEISGFASDRNANKDLKRYYTTQYWLPAANNLGTYGRWDFIEVTDIDNVRAIINQKINEL